VSTFRGHPVAAAAKCIILILKLGKKITRFVLAVVPGNARVDTDRVRALLGATYVGFAATAVAERLAGRMAGTVLPFAFHPDLTLIADPALKSHEEVFFNAARLDQSVSSPDRRLFCAGKDSPGANRSRRLGHDLSRLS
jgi:Ala-tRNA(Pro) deacylase